MAPAPVRRAVMSVLHPLEGHEDRQEAVIRSFREDRLPSTLLLHGPPGVGKQRFALWLGQLVLCEENTGGGPCGDCRGCRMVLGLQHPDLLWYFPVPRPPSRGSKERNEEALEDIRHETLEQIRSTPLRSSHSTEVRGLQLGTIHNLRREASRRPSLGERRLFIIAQAEELVAQESADEAANALLKTLEEPPANTWFVLTSAEVGRLLPTIRSRATSIYMPPLSDSKVRAFLERGWEGSSEEIDKAVALSGGSIGRALGFLPEGEDPGPLDAIRRDAARLIRTVVRRSAAERYLHALDHQPARARGLQELLGFLEGWLRDLAAVATSDDAPVLNRDAADWLRKTVHDHRIHPDDAARAVLHVESARESAAGNVNPQLLMNVLLTDLHQTLFPDHPETRGSEAALR